MTLSLHPGDLCYAIELPHIDRRTARRTVMCRIVEDRGDLVLVETVYRKVLVLTPRANLVEAR